MLSSSFFCAGCVCHTSESLAPHCMLAAVSTSMSSRGAAQNDLNSSKRSYIACMSAMHLASIFLLAHASRC